MKKGKKCLRWVLLLLGAVALAGWISWENTALELNSLSVTCPLLPEQWNGLRIAQVSDLHNAQLGAENETLLQLLRQAQPDVIAITGDLVDSRRTDTQIALDFVEEAMKIAPCCYVPGNHESRLEADALAAFEEALRGLGVAVLRNSTWTFMKDGESLTFVGMDDPDFAGQETDSLAPQILPLLQQDSFEILLSHRPELFEAYVAAGADLVLSGHAHGGQIRLPYFGGVFAPHQGLFAKYDAGLYADGNTRMVVSRGVGNSFLPIRINNRPEVVLIEVQCE